MISLAQRFDPAELSLEGRWLAASFDVVDGGHLRFAGGGPQVSPWNPKVGDPLCHHDRYGCDACELCVTVARDVVRRACARLVSRTTRHAFPPLREAIPYLQRYVDVAPPMRGKIRREAEAAVARAATARIVGRGGDAALVMNVDDPLLWLAAVADA